MARTIRFWSIAGALLFAAAMAAAPARATVIVEQAPAFGGNSVTSDASGPIAFDDFVLSSDSTITDVRWWDHADVLPLDEFTTFTIAFYQYDSPVTIDLTPLYEQDVQATNTLVSALFEYEFDATLPVAADLAAGQYWISIVGHGLIGGRTFSWIGSDDTADGAFPLSGILQSGNFMPNVPNLSFALEDNPVSVPESMSIWLLLGGLGAFAWSRRKFGAGAFTRR